MTWIRKGKLFDRNVCDLDWLKLNIQLPIPYLIAEKRLRLFLTFCDDKNRGRLGYIDINPDDPSEILGYSREPLLDIGEPGCFDENGVVSTAILVDGEQIFLYYCGFQKHVNYPYSSLTGIAVSHDNGESFTRLKKTPLLERRDGEMFIRTGAGIYKYGEIYRLYYAAGNEWLEIDGKLVPKYSFKYIDSKLPYIFDGDGMDLFPLANDEYGMTTPQILEIDKGYEMFYSIRSISDGYRMGYAISEDGINFERKDEWINIERPAGEFDSEMICYGKCYRHKGRTYLFYSGNHFGLDGIGWAEYEE